MLWLNAESLKPYLQIVTGPIDKPVQKPEIARSLGLCRNCVVPVENGFESCPACGSRQVIRKRCERPTGSVS